MVTSLHNLCLSKGMAELGNVSFIQAVEAGVEIVQQMIIDGKAKIVIVNGKRYIDVFDLKDTVTEYSIQTVPVKLINSSKVYLRWEADDNDELKSKKSYVVKPTYLFKQSEQPKKLLTVLGKQNSLKWRTNKWVLDFVRENKKGTSDDLFETETELMRQAIEQVDRFYLGHRFDKRGRLYSDGYLLNYQSDEWCKAAISCCIKPEKLSKEGWKQMDIDLANHCGLDKATFDDRLKAVDNSYDTTSINKGKIKKPLLAHKNILARKEALANDNISDYCVGVDATASGMQLLAIMANCSETAKLTNLTDPSKCYDIYGEACKKILEITKSNLEVSDIRDIVKKALMTRGYNSELQIKIAKNELAKMKIHISLNSLLDILDISNKVTKCKEAMNNCLIDTFSVLDNDKQIIRYTMPDGFIVEFGNITKAETTFACRKFRVQMKFDRLGWNKEENWRALAPNLVHSIDGYICREMIRRLPFQIYTVHDCFYCHPNNVLAMRRMYIAILKEVQKMDILSYICKQINPSFEYKVEGEKFEIAVDDNSYCLC